MTRTAGSRIGPYEIVALLGAGGMGEVYRARDTRLGRDVAIKIVGATSADQSAQARLIREAQHASILNHPHICTIHEVGETADGAFFVMEYVNGQTLGAMIPPDGLPVEVVVRYGGQIADALVHAHNQGIVHRDLKSANVMITPEGRIKVLDFGVARRLSSHNAHDITQSRNPLTADGVMAGTLAYMAPEILQGKPADERSDIWAFGVLLQEMAAGERPFKGQTGFDLTSAILRDSPATLPQRVPATIRRIVQKCLAKDPQQRYQRASEVRAALELSQPEPSNDLVVRVEPVQAQGPPMTTSRARRSLAWILVGSLACLAVGIGLWVAGRGLGFWSASLDARTVLILPFEVRGQDDGGDYVGRAFAEALAMHLARTEGLHVLPVPDVGELGAGGSLSRVAAARDVGAGRLLTGALTRSEGALQVSLSLMDTTGNRVTWGAQKEGSTEMLSIFAALLAQEFAAHVGAASTRRYNYFMYDTGSPDVAASPEMTAALSDVRRLNASDLESTKRLVETFPNEPAARVLRALALFGVWYNDPSQYPAFENSLVLIDRIDPKNPWDDVFRALYLMNSGRDREAIEGFGKVLARDDLTPAARANVLSLRGRAQASLAHFAAAFADLEDAVRLDPANDVSFYMLAASLFQAGRIEEALTRARQAVALNPGSSQNNGVLGASLGRVGRWDQALPFLARACETDRSQGTCGQNAVGLLQAGRNGEAVRKVKEAESMPETGSGAYTLACYNALAGNRAEALQLLQRAIDLGFIDAAFADGPGLASLRGDPKFEALVAEVKRIQAQGRGR